MEYLWPYKQTKNTALFKDGEKEFHLRKKGNNVYWKGDKINKTLFWNVFETINLSEIKFIKE